MSLPKNVEDLYELTPMQHAMLLHAIAEDGNGVLLNQVAYDMRGSLDKDAFGAAWDDLVARHAALRTVFLWDGLPQPVQAVRTSAPFRLAFVDLAALPPDERTREASRLESADARAPMSLDKAPLMRGTLIRLGDEHHRFLWSVHHLVVDRWSYAVIIDELRALYAGRVNQQSSPQLRPAPLFREYVAWISRQDPTRAERFWREELAGFREHTRLAPAESVAMSAERFTTRLPLDAESSAQLRARAAQWRTTVGAVMLAAIGLLLARRNARDHVLYGLTVSGRPHDVPDVEATVGSFVNNVPLRLRIDREQLLDDWVRELQRAEGRRQSFAHVSPARILDWSDLPANRQLFDTLVLLNLGGDIGGEWPGLQLDVVSSTLDAAYPFILAADAQDNRFGLTLVHDATFGGAELVLRELADVLQQVATAHDGLAVGELLPAHPQSVAAAIGEPAHGVSVPTPRPADADVPDTDRGSIADQLLRAWRDVLGSDRIGLDDDFFASGGTSMQAAQLFARIDRITGKVLPLTTLFVAGSVRGIMAELDQPLAREHALVSLQSCGTRAPLLVVPGIGGSTVGLHGLSRRLGKDQPFSAFESPGLDGREAPLTSIEEIAARYVKELLETGTPEFHLMGLCWGAGVAFEMARRLSAAGRPPLSLSLLDPAVLLRDTASSSVRAESRFLRDRLELYWDEFREGDWRDRTRMLVNKAKRAAKILNASHEKVEFMRELNHTRVVEANTLAITRYVPDLYQGTARLFLTSDREIDTGADPRLEWVQLIEPAPGVVWVDGINSFDAIAPAHVGKFAGTLRSWLDASSSR